MSKAIAVDAPRFLTVPEAANLLRVQPHKILGWIRRGDLRAIDVSARRGIRPRWRIRADDWDSFLLTRQAIPPVKPIRRRRRPLRQVKQYF